MFVDLIPATLMWRWSAENSHRLPRQPTNDFYRQKWEELRVGGDLKNSEFLRKHVHDLWSISPFAPSFILCLLRADFSKHTVDDQEEKAASSRMRCMHSDLRHTFFSSCQARVTRVKATWRQSKKKWCSWPMASHIWRVSSVNFSLICIFLSSPTWRYSTTCHQVH